MDNRNFIAKRAAAYFRPGDVVNLGIGIPSLCGSYAVDGVLFQSENGFIGIGPTVQEGLMKTSASSMRAECPSSPCRGAAPSMWPCPSTSSAADVSPPRCWADSRCRHRGSG